MSCFVSQNHKCSILECQGSLVPHSGLQIEENNISVQFMIYQFLNLFFMLPLQSLIDGFFL